MTSVDVVIVTHNSANDLRACVESLDVWRGEIDLVIHVHDNASTDRTDDEIRALLDAGRIARHKSSGSNLGFAKACNDAARAADSHWLLFLNPDARAESPLGGLVRHLGDPDVAVVSPAIVDWHGDEAAFAFALPHNPLGLMAAWLRALLGRGQPERIQLNRLEPGLHEYACDWVLGAAMFVRRSDFEAVGGFDERFFLYWEDVDLCKVLIARGRRVIASRQSLVRHRKFGSSAGDGRRVFEHRRRSERQYYRKHHGVLGEAVVALFDRGGELYRS
ncbi:glycosyltransferase family 2 protein [Mycobacterium sp. BMJ-28]